MTASISIVGIPMDLGPRQSGAIVLVGAPKEGGEPVSMLAALGGVAVRNAQLQDTQRNFWMSAEEALEYHLIDQVIEHMDSK